MAGEDKDRRKKVSAIFYPVQTEFSSRHIITIRRGEGCRKILALPSEFVAMQLLDFVGMLFPDCKTVHRQEGWEKIRADGEDLEVEWCTCPF